jgi:glutaredoxin/glutathione-dependent peroxiredoxin
MTIQVGETMPAGKFRSRNSEGVQEISTEQLFKGKKVVLFAVPGAFTPTCNDKHLPGFVVQFDALKAKGVDTIACTAVNDHFVLQAWAKATNAAEYVLMLADGNGDYAKALGLPLDLSHIGLGVRSRRYAAIVEDGVLKYLGVETGPEVGVSSADAVLAQL